MWVTPFFCAILTYIVFKIDDFLNPHLADGVARHSASLQRTENTPPSSEFMRLEFGPPSADYEAV